MKAFLKNHYLVFLVAAFVGLICIVPNMFFILSLGDAYKGISMQFTDESAYLARIQEILDGHPLIGSSALFEYKNQMPLAPPTGEFFYAIPSLIFNISPVNILIAGRFFLPFILFLLVYHLIKQLTENKASLSNPEESRRVGIYGASKINAIAGALLITLGYDLIDYRTVFNYLKGISAPSDFLIWTRPVNPILGAIFLTSFLIFLWLIIQKQEIKQKKLYIVGASVFLALMIASYFFSWGMAISIAGVLILIYLLKKEYKAVKNLIIVVILGFLLSLPYWYMAWRASQSPWYHDALPRNGLFYTHYPLLNKFMLMVLGIYLLCIFLPILIGRLRGEKIIIRLDNWHWFCLAFVLGALWAYSQQIITGMTIWPYHFVQYSIPLAIIVFMVLFYNVIREKFRFLWKAGIFVIILISLFLGIYTQASVYKQVYPYYSDLQSYAPLLDWINQQEKDCVVLTQDESKTGRRINLLILAFTHCNVYDSNGNYAIVPSDRIYHNYLVRMLFDGATAQNVDKYLEKPKMAPFHYLSSNWRELLGIKDFPDVPNNLEEKIKKLPEDYKKFFAQDLKSELKKYKLDYIIIKGKVEGKAADLIKELNLVYTSGNFSVYKF